jgi:hypothetical protein
VGLHFTNWENCSKLFQLQFTPLNSLPFATTPPPKPVAK